MIAIFYDRKNQKEVKSSQLVSIKLNRNRLCSDQDEAGPAVDELIVRSESLGRLGYKSDQCPSYKNWDMWLNGGDLIFLRMEEE